MDHLCKTAFQLMQEDCVQKLLYQQHKVSLLESLSYGHWLDSLLKRFPQMHSPQDYTVATAFFKLCVNSVFSQ